jgi:hypothetical protein
MFDRLIPIKQHIKRLKYMALSAPGFLVSLEDKRKCPKIGFSSLRVSVDLEAKQKAPVSSQQLASGLASGGSLWSGLRPCFHAHRSQHERASRRITPVRVQGRKLCGLRSFHGHFTRMPHFPLEPSYEGSDSFGHPVQVQPNVERCRLQT